MKNWHIWAGILALGFVLGSCMLGSSDDEPSRTEVLSDVVRACEDFIEERLKAPSTAEFDLRAFGGPTTYTASGTVDAENSFGAKIRGEVTCKVEDAGSTWKLVSITGL